MSQTTGNGVIRIVIIGLTVIVLAPIVMMGFGTPLVGMWGGGMMNGYGGATVWNFGIILLWLLIGIGGGYLIYREVTPTDTEDPAIEDLRMAYARGDIAEAEFEERLERLQRDE